MMQHIVACHPQFRTVPSGVWFGPESGRNIQPHCSATTFILAVKIDTLWVCLVVRLEQHEAQLLGSLSDSAGEKAEMMCEKLASRFIAQCLPEEFNNWDDGWHTVRSDHELPQYNANESAVFCLWVAFHIALGLQVPASWDYQLNGSFLHAVFTNIKALQRAEDMPSQLMLGH
jgi:hypothetical protein